jgi:hypothetical protein
MLRTTPGFAFEDFAAVPLQVNGSQSPFCPQRRSLAAAVMPQQGLIDARRSMHLFGHQHGPRRIEREGT